MEMKKLFWFLVGIGISQLLWLTVAYGASVGVHGGYTNPHSDCDGDSCLDPGYGIGVSVEDDWSFNEHFGIRYGVTGWRFDFSKADRDTSSSPRHNVKGQVDYILTGTVKPSVTLYGISLYPTAGVGMDTSGELYTVLGGGIDAKVYGNWHIELQSQAVKAKCTWHRTTTIGVRYVW
jgi:hypothetical protein